MSLHLKLREVDCFSPVMYGLAAVSKDPKPLPMMNIAAQKPPKDRCKMQGHATNAPIP